LAARALLPFDDIERAHALFAAGHYPAAAQAFENLSQTHPARAPFLLLQAGRAYLLAGSPETGMAYLRRGLLLLTERGQSEQLQRVGNRIAQELRQRGLEAQAREIESLLEGPTFPQAVLPARAPLPTHCPSCGGPLRSDEVDWLDEFHAQCDFCGSPVRTLADG